MGERLARARAIIAGAVKNWGEDNVPRLSAAFAFYAILSLSPLLIFAIAIAGRFLGEASARAQILAEARGALGQPAADFLGTLIENTTKPGAGTIATIFAILVALYGASNLFGQLHEAVNSIWGIKERTGGFIQNFLRGKVLSVLMLLVFVTLFLGWIAVDSWLGWLSRRAGGFVGMPVISFVASVLFLTLVFAASMKGIPRDMVKWGDVWMPAFITGIAVALGKILLGLYFSYAGVANAYGPAGALVVILLWIYYTAQIYFFGIELTYTYAHLYGSHKNEEPLGLKRS